LSFTLNNHTDKTFDKDIDVGLDFYSDGQLVTGTHYFQSHSDGLSLKPHETKKVTATFPNTLGMRNYTVNMNIKTDKSLTVHEEITPGITFYNTHGKSQFFAVVTDAEFTIE
jgi:hypothetical protein